MQRAIWVLWPAFIVGGITETVFFTLFDPEDMRLFGEAITLSRSAVYTLGFFVFWMLAAIPSVLRISLISSSIAASLAAAVMRWSSSRSSAAFTASAGVRRLPTKRPPQILD